MSSPSRLSAEEIDQAGQILVRLPADAEPDDAWLAAVHQVSDWRALHAGPLQTFATNLRRRVGRRGVVAQRLKRLPSIIGKLERLQRIRLSDMQDIGGCRAVVGRPEDAFAIATELMASRIRHRLVNQNNYITLPRRSGYRGLHLMYSYASDRAVDAQGLNIEIQIRSQLQHQWATAVETASTFLRENLKASQGDNDWLRFFALMSAVMANREGTTPVPETPTDHNELVNEIRMYDQKHRIVERLGGFQALTSALPSARKFRNRWMILELDLDHSSVSGRGYPADEQAEAVSHYLKRELESRENPRIDVVLVQADSVAALRRAYPNYFADLSQFRQFLSETLAGN